MNATELLRQQHREVEKLFQMIEVVDGERRAELIQELADLFAAHAMIEEQIFYPSTQKSRTEDQVSEAIEEHHAVERTLTELLDYESSDPQVAVKLAVAKEQIQHHVEEEETELFPTAERDLAGELDELGEEMEALYAEALAETPRERPREEPEHAPPG